MPVACEKNPQEVMWDENRKEMDLAITRFLRRIRLDASNERNRQAAMELYDLGYDHGSTMEAEYGDHDA